MKRDAQGAIPVSQAASIASAEVDRSKGQSDGEHCKTSRRCKVYWDDKFLGEGRVSGKR